MASFPTNTKLLTSALLNGALKIDQETLETVAKSLEAIEKSMEKYLEGEVGMADNLQRLKKQNNKGIVVGGKKRKNMEKKKAQVDEEKNRIDVGQFAILCSDGTKLHSDWRQIPPGLFACRNLRWRYPTMSSLALIYTNPGHTEQIMKSWDGLSVRVVCFYWANNPIDAGIRAKMERRNWMIEEIIDLPKQLSIISSSKTQNSCAVQSVNMAKVPQKTSNEKLPSSSNSFIPNVNSSESGSAKIGQVTQKQYNVKMPNFSTEFKIGSFQHNTSCEAGSVKVTQQQYNVKMPNFSTEFKIGSFQHNNGNCAKTSGAGARAGLENEKMTSCEAGSVQAGQVTQQQYNVKMPNFSTEFKIGTFLHNKEKCAKTNGAGDGLEQKKMATPSTNLGNPEKYTFTMLKNKEKCDVEKCAKTNEVNLEQEKIVSNSQNARKMTELTMEQYKRKMASRAACENSTVLQKIPPEFRDFYTDVQFDEKIELDWKMKLDQILDANRELRETLRNLKAGNNF